MKVSELREKIKQRKKEELQKLIVEMYKQIPKAVRENKEIDALIDDLEQFQSKRVKGNNRNINFDELKHKVEQFIEDAYAQNYFAPNRKIPKKERSNWRITAKRLVNDVTTLANQPEYIKDCTILLEKMYILFCYASGHYVFKSEEPFYTIKIPQGDFLKRVILLKRQVEEPDKWIRGIMLLILDNDVDRNTLSETLLETLLEELNNAPLKERAINICEDLMKERMKRFKKSSRSKRRSFDYRTESEINNIVKMIFMLQSLLGEYEQAVAFYKQHYIESPDEVKLFILLTLIMGYQRPQNWIKEYELAVANQVDPRDRLQRAYEYIKRTNEFPEYIF